MPLLVYWLIYANICYLTYSSLNDETGIPRDDYDQVVLSTSSSFPTNGTHRHQSKRPVLRLRQLPGTVQTVTATVTLTVTNTVFPTSSPVSTVLPSTSTAALPLATNPQSQVSEIPTPPEFVTATDQALAPSTQPPASSVSTNALPSSSPLPSPITSDPSLPTSTTIASVPTTTPSPLGSLSPISTSTFSASSLASSLPLVYCCKGAERFAKVTGTNSSGEANNGDPGNEDTKGLNRLLVPFIVISVICSLGLVVGFLFYLSPYLREARLRQQARSGSIFEDYSHSARTFEPNPTGTLNYHRSLSRKRNHRAQLLQPTTAALSNKIPRPKTKSLDTAALWLPQTSAGPGLTRPS
ncbi:hypothetical protein PSHT_11209 [Puccinia striiformis]|uniref:Mid2 domain-containing protein n=1 Tax=Puccinia striiformis TaxID=27350 RepID=A0A2S4V4S9_9BASI|nr:hypothetical protein PSHT_11209 [Puccinia striiformis]